MPTAVAAAPSSQDSSSSTPKTAKKSSKKKTLGKPSVETSVPLGPEIPKAWELPDFHLDKTYDHPVMVRLPSDSLMQLVNTHPSLQQNPKMVGAIITNDLMSDGGRMDAIERLAARLEQPQRPPPPRQGPGSPSPPPAMSEEDAKAAEEEIGLLERRVEVLHGPFKGYFGTVEQLDACGTSATVSVNLPSGNEQLACVPAKYVEPAQLSLQGGYLMQSSAFPSDVPSLGSVCATCGTRAKSTCSKCGRARYCSKECQLEGWNIGHKASCKASRPLAAKHGGNVGDHVAVLVDLLRELKGSGVDAVLEILRCLLDCTSPPMVKDTCALLNAGAARAIVLACGRYPDHLEVQRVGLELLSHISGERERPRKPGGLEVFIAGGLETAACALRAFMYDLKVQNYGLCVLSSVAGMICSSNRLVAKRTAEAASHLVELPLAALRVHVLGSLPELMRATAGADNQHDSLRPLYLGLPAFAALSSILHGTPEPLFEKPGQLDFVIMCMHGLASRELARFDAVTIGSAPFGPFRMQCLGYACPAPSPPPGWLASPTRFPRSFTDQRLSALLNPAHRYACRTLANAIIESHSRKAKVGAAGGAQAAVAAMRASNDASLQADGCMLLRNLMTATQRGSPRMSASGRITGDALCGMAPDVVEAGGVELLHRALGLHPKDAAVTTAALGALFNLYNDAAMSGDPSRIPRALLEAVGQPTKEAARRAAKLHEANQQITVTAKMLIELVNSGEGYLVPGCTTQRR